MAATARTKEECKEFFDTPEVLDKKIKNLADKIRKSKHMTAFTGAGISTSAGIPDFRSGVNTILKTGAGKWERDAHNKKVADPKKKIESRASPDVMKTAFPTYTHMALKALIEHGYLKHLVSQNTDGLHIRSGVPKKNFSELHGNRNLERCKKCKMEFLRDYQTRVKGNKVHDHSTGRNCENCGGNLIDTIINFGENLPEHEIDTAFANAEASDLCLALGSSLTVTPAADVPRDVAIDTKTGRKKGDLYIVNLQGTPLDNIATGRLNGFTDDVMRKLMKELNIEVPHWKLMRGVEVELVRKEPSAVGSVLKSSIGGSVKVVANATNAKKSSTTPRKSSISTINSSRRSSVMNSARGGVNSANTVLKINGFNPDNGQPHSYFKKVELDADFLDANIRNKNTITGGSSNEIKFDFPIIDNFEDKISKTRNSLSTSSSYDLNFELEFYGHYKEPNLRIKLDTEKLKSKGKQFFVLALNFQTMAWEVLEKESRKENYHPITATVKPKVTSSTIGSLPPPDALLNSLNNLINVTGGKFGSAEAVAA